VLLGILDHVPLAEVSDGRDRLIARTGDGGIFSRGNDATQAPEKPLAKQTSSWFMQKAQDVHVFDASGLRVSSPNNS
jgi:hypothetical protein